MAQPRFSIVIPTRNRPETLRHALATCLDQDFDDYEIVVCDNSDSDATLKVVEAANSRRIRYLPSGRPLAMTANWERGLSEAHGEYVTVLGDDDGLMPYALRELDALASRTGMKAIHWHRGLYTWPTIEVAEDANYLMVPLSRTESKIDGRTQIAKVIRFETGADQLPMIYCSAIHRDLIEKHRAMVGRVFSNVYPDVYSGFSFAYLAGTYLSVSTPMNLAGLSHASNGVATLMLEERNTVAKDFMRLNAEFGFVRHPLVPDHMALGPIHIVDCFLYAKDALFPQDSELVLDRKAVTQRYLAAIPEGDPEARAELRQLIRASIADSPELIRWFDGEVPHFPPAPANRIRPERLGYNGNALSIDAASLGVQDVAGAARTVAALLGFDSSPIVYDMSTPYELQGQIAAAQHARFEAVEDAARARRQAEEDAAHARVRLQELQAQNDDLAHQLRDAQESSNVLLHRLNEAQRLASLRYVPRRLLTKLLGIVFRHRSAH
jgi:glycosyltransferase involved in cell wall biosynthesis